MENYNNTILLPHNQEAFQKVMEHFHSNKRAAVVHATGTGKSFIIAAVASRFAGRIVVIAPNTFVLDETRKLCGGKVDFRTYASVMYDDSPASDYELIVLDEFHRAGAEEWGKGVDRLLAANPDAKVLGTSATAIRYLDGQRNMSDELFDGNVVSSLPLREAIDRGIIPEPTYVASLYAFDDTYAAVKQQIMASNKKSEEEKMKAMRTLDGIAHNWENAHGVGLIMRKYLDKDIKRIIVFCSKVARAAKARNILGPWLASAGYKHIRFYNIDYKEKRLEKEMEDFQNNNFDGVKVAISVNMLNEGVHIPNVDAVVMMRSTVSPNIIMQQIGRCLTAKKTGHKPVIIDLVNNMDTLGLLNLWSFSDSKASSGEHTDDCLMNKGLPFHVIDECRDIRTFLTQVQTEFDVVTDFYPKFWEFVEKNDRLPKSGVKEEKPLYDWCSAVWNNKCELADRFPDVYNKLKEMRFGEYSDLQTERKVREFWEFIGKYDRLPKSSVKEEKKLYVWCQGLWGNRWGLANRFPEVYNKLKEMRFGEGTDIQTEKRVEEFFEFVEKNGRLPKQSVKEEKSLYQWCQNVSGNLRGLADRCPEVYAKLKELRFGNSADVKTEKRVKEFWKFVNTHGRLPKINIKEECSLCDWCGRVWNNERELADRFPEVYAKLKEMNWKNKKEKTEAKVEEIKEFIRTHGRLPRMSVNEEKSLYNYISGFFVSNSKLAERFPDVYAKLKELRWGEKNNIHNDARLADLKKFIQENGRLPRKSDKNAESLYRWCGTVWLNKKGLADRCPEALTLLKKLGWGNVLNVKTEARAEEFWNLVDAYGRLPIPSIKSEKPLYMWCRNVLLNVSNLADRYPEVLAKIKELKEKK